MAAKKSETEDVTPGVAPLAMTSGEAAKRYPGTEERQIARMCLKGQRLAKKYKGASRVPVAEKRTALFGKKVAKYWYIPISELDRVFLP